MSRTAFVKSCLHGDVLDVGYSVGPLHEEISRNRNVIAIDTVIREPKTNAVKADATLLPFRDSSFDSVLAGELLEHLQDPSLFLRESSRVLKPSGTLVLTTPNRKSLLNRLFKSYEKPAHLSLFTRTELLSLLSAHGFSMEKFALFPYTRESSEGSSHVWFYPVRRLLHHFLPGSLRENIAVAARKGGS